jgi:hypothetical protein
MMCFGGAPIEYCGGHCVDTNSDTNFCAGAGNTACGGACPSGKVCADGKCAAKCAPDQGMCGASCADFIRDPNNCGGCGIVCPPGRPNCQDGQCFGF